MLHHPLSSLLILTSRPPTRKIKIPRTKAKSSQVSSVSNATSQIKISPQIAMISESVVNTVKSHLLVVHHGSAKIVETSHLEKS